MANDTTAEKNLNLNRLDVILNCITETSSAANDAGENHLLLKIQEVFQQIAFFFKRLGYAIAYLEWFDNKAASSAVKWYAFEATAAQKTAVHSQKMISIYDKLKAAAHTQKPYLVGVEKNWIEAQPDGTEPFQPFKKSGTISTRMLFHIHADEFGANNSSLEGFHAQNTLDYLCCFLKKRQQQKLSLYGLKAESLDQLTTAHQL